MNFVVGYIEFENNLFLKVILEGSNIIENVIIFNRL